MECVLRTENDHSFVQWLDIDVGIRKRIHSELTAIAWLPLRVQIQTAGHNS
jgi:hypothetical protein